MLDKLIINNIALIERAEIEFGEGLNVLSGETGAGKSVILDSINFVLGAKADKNMIRHGETECSVRAVFYCGENEALRELLQDMDVDADDEIVIVRKYRADGRGEIKVNGCCINASMLRKITAHLVDVHGQSEHFYLLSETNQLKVLDRAAKGTIESPKNKLSELLAEKKDIEEKLSALGGDEAERGRRLDILKYQIDEIERAAPAEGEEEALLAKKEFYANIEKIMRALSEAGEYLNGENAAIDCFNGAKRAVSEIARLGEYAALYDRLENLSLEAEDLGETISAMSENVNFDESEAEETENRLDLLKALKRKYGATIPEVLRFAEKAKEEYDLLLHSDEEYARLSDMLTKNRKAVLVVCRELTRIRKETAQNFCSQVEQELKTLNIKNAKFCAEFDEYGEEDINGAAHDGMDRMRFLFSANAGEPLKPLNKVISGGEMSRLMLAIKTKTSDENDISTYIFDEIDAGISGATAQVVAEKFADIAKSKQIIAVSHLAQIAAMADENYLISKSEGANGKTLTEINKLGGKDRKKELVRLLGGDTASEAALSLAEELSQRSVAYKSKI